VSHLGAEGYLRLAGQVREATRRFRAGIEAIPGLRITGAPVLGVMEVSSDDIDLAAVNDVMDDRGWHLDRQQGGLHLMLSPGHVAVADAFLADLADAVASHGPSRGVEARYGGIDE
jgi:glutamate/tyrosine decarboxylase-like PLP-dependent enzyme